MTVNVSSMSKALPAIIYRAGEDVGVVWEEFFDQEIASLHTRRAYLHAVNKFLAWSESRGLELLEIIPGNVRQYLHEMPTGVPTEKLHLAALRKFFECLVNHHLIVINPAASVRGTHYPVADRKTPEIQAQEVETLMKSIMTTYKHKSETRSDLLGLRDRAILAVLVFTAARVGAIARLTFDDLRPDGPEYSLCFLDKGGKSREIPVLADLRKVLFAYIQSAQISEGPIFRAARGPTRTLKDHALKPDDICTMIKRRIKAAGLSIDLSPHSFRVAAITNLLKHNASLEDIQHLAGHADPRTTRLYDQRRKITRSIVKRNIVEHISMNLGED